MPAGRPTVMTKEVIAKLEEGFSMGFTDLEACLYANISKDSLYDYIKINPKFSDRKEVLKNHPKLLAKRNIVESLKDNKDIKNSQWYAETKMKKEFSKKLEIEGDLDLNLKFDETFNTTQRTEEDGEESSEV